MLGKIINAYTPKAYTGRVNLFIATEKEKLIGVNYEVIRVPIEEQWKEFATEGLEIHEVPGNHKSMTEEPHVKILAEKLAFHLGKSLTD